MDKTININLGGTLFQIDEAAYGKLKDYLQSINNKFRNTAGGNETIEDIESRIAEIFMSMKGTAGVISSDNVDEMIKLIGRPEDFDQTFIDNETQRSSFGNPGPRKKMFRNPENSIISGVCGGIGAYLNSDPVWIRILFVLFAFFFGIGFFVYLALWIAIPSAMTDSQKREMYGGQHNWAMPQEWDQHPGNRLGHAINEVFRAIGKVCFVICRIILILFGTVIVLTGFVAILTFVMIFVFHYPGSFSADFGGANLAYLPDFIRYIVSPAAAPWVKGLILFVVVLPFIALIYGGIRLIFWFRVRDGFIWLTGFIFWVLCATALSIILFSEGVNYANKGNSVTSYPLNLPGDTLYIEALNKLSDIKTANEISIPDNGGNGYQVFINDEKKEINIKSHLDIEPSEDKTFLIEVTRHSTGRSTIDASENSKQLQYAFNQSGNRLFVDEYFTIPQGRKWLVDYVSSIVWVPVGTIVHISDDINETIIRSKYNEDKYEGRGDIFWLMTKNGLEPISPKEK
jgi:phage shock protein PspC (stress-responsive transcriptional regulator)